MKARHPQSQPMKKGHTVAHEVKDSDFQMRQTKQTAVGIRYRCTPEDMKRVERRAKQTRIHNKHSSEAGQRNQYFTPRFGDV